MKLKSEKLNKELSIEEARELYNELKEVFGEDKIEYVPYEHIRYPWYPDPIYPAITCGTGSNG
jgi:hypothetical protein